MYNHKIHDSNKVQIEECLEKHKICDGFKKYFEQSFVNSWENERLTAKFLKVNEEYMDSTKWSKEDLKNYRLLSLNMQ